MFGSGADSGFNVIKFLLSIFAMAFDLIFLFQHYVLYRDKWDKPVKAELEKKLAPETSGEGNEAFNRIN